MSYQMLGATAPVTDATVAALEIVRDPYLAEAACEVMRLRTLEATGRLAAPCPRTPAKFSHSTAGVGLREVVGPLRLWQQHVRRPWLVPTAAAVVIGLAYFLGTQNR